MATKQFLTLDGLTTYDGLIKQYIGTEDAKSIKSITVVGNTVNFYKNASASGDPSYTVNLPDVSGFMDKIENPDGGKIVVSDANGGVEETDISPDDIITGYFRDDATNGDIIVYSKGTGAAVSSLNLEDVTTGYFTDSTAGDIVVFDGTDKTIRGASIRAADIMEKIDAATGGYLAISTNEGGVSESSISEQDVTNALDDINDIVGDITGLQTDVSTLQGDVSTLQGDVGDLQTDVSDLQTNKMDKIDSATGGNVVISTANGGVKESSYTFVTGYITTTQPGTGDIVVFGQPRTGENTITVNGTGVSLSSIQSGISTAQGDVDALEALVGSIPQESSATTVIGYVDEQVEAIGDDSEVTIAEAKTPTTGYLKTYEISQGGTLIGKIDIPKDLVVTSGEIVVNPTGQPAGTYLKLTIANQTAPVYINVADLCDVYTAQASAAQVQLAISATNEISATIVAGSIGTTELANSAVTTGKIADDAVTADKVSIAAHTEAQTAGADGVAISVTTTDGQVSGVTASIAANTYDAYGAASAAVAALDATPSQTAGSDGLALSLTEVDGVVTAISGSIAANTYDAYGAASTVQSTVVGSAGDAASANTINGAKAYADAATAAIATADIEALFS